MKEKRTKSIIEGKIFDVLNLEYQAQNPAEYLCVIYSLMMVFDYLDEFYLIPNGITPPDHHKEKLIKEQNTDIYTGTNLSPDIIKKFAKNYIQYDFFYRRSSLKEIEKSIKSNYPVIVIYNPSMITLKEKGPSHAGVVAGIDDDKIILYNPWYGKGFNCDPQRFEEGWDLEYCVSLYIKPKMQKELEE